MRAWPTGIGRGPWCESGAANPPAFSWLPPLTLGSASRKKTTRNSAGTILFALLQYGCQYPSNPHRKHRRPRRRSRCREGQARLRPQFLVPRGKALEVTPATLKRLNLLKAKRAEREARELNEAEELARRINKLKITLELETGETGKAFGSITAADIAERLKAELGGSSKSTATRSTSRSRSRKPARTKSQIKLHHDVTAKLNLNVKAKRSRSRRRGGSRSRRSRGSDGKGLQAQGRRPGTPSKRAMTSEASSVSTAKPAGKAGKRGGRGPARKGHLFTGYSQVTPTEPGCRAGRALLLPPLAARGRRPLRREAGQGGALSHPCARADLSRCCSSCGTPPSRSISSP